GSLEQLADPAGSAPGPIIAAVAAAIWTLVLFNHPARHSGTAATQRLWMVGVVVAALVHHQRQALDVAEALQAWRQYRLAALAITVDEQRWQVAHVSVTPGLAVLAAVLWVPVASR